MSTIIYVYMYKHINTYTYPKQWRCSSYAYAHFTATGEALSGRGHDAAAPWISGIDSH